MKHSVKRLLVVIFGLGLLPAAGPASLSAGQDPLDLQPDLVAAGFGSVYQYQAGGKRVETWIWLGLLGADATVRLQFYDRQCDRTNDIQFEMTDQESRLVVASDAAPDADAGVFLVEAVCRPAATLARPCALLGEAWYLDREANIMFTRPLYTPSAGGIGGVWDVFQHEHWDTIRQGSVRRGSGPFVTHLWLNCPTGSGEPGGSGDNDLYVDLLQGVPLLPGPARQRTLPGGLPGASLADFLLIHSDETPGGSRDDVPCPCLTDGPLTSFSGLFHDFIGLVRVRFKGRDGDPAVGLVHKTEGWNHRQVFDKRFHRTVP